MKADLIDQLRAGIAPYTREQQVILRLLRKRGQFTEREFDSWFRGREWRRPLRATPVSGDAFILGMGQNGGNEWAWWLDLVQHMMVLGIVTSKTENGMIVYILPK